MSEQQGRIKECRAKKDELLTLAKKRQSSRWEGYYCIGDYHGGKYECDFVSPYSKGACNIEAQIMVLLQDWSSHEWLSGPLNLNVVELGHSSGLPTNKNLCRLLFDSFGIELTATYSTNLFPFIKPGGMSSAIKHADLIRAAHEFAIPQINIVAPRLVICLGLVTFNALREAQGESRVSIIAEAIANPFRIGVSKVWCQAHTGALGQNNRRKGNILQVTEDWRRMKAEFDTAGQIQVP